MALIAHYKCNDNAGNTTVLDSLGVVNGTADVNTSTITTTGKRNEGFDLTASNYFSLGTGAPFNFGDGSFSFSIWFKKSSVTTEDVLLAKRNWVLATEDGYSIGFTSATNLRVHWNSDQNYTVPSITDSQWHHLVVIFNGNAATTSVYLDNSFINTLSHTADSNQTNTNTLYVGRSNNASPILAFDGHIDDVRFYNHRLATAEIAFLYNTGSGTEVEEGGLDALVSFLSHLDGTDGSTTPTDVSTFAHTITAQAQAQIDTAQSKFGGASALFDGSNDRFDIPDNDTAFNFAAGDFTIDFWAKKAALGATTHLVGQWEGGNNKMLSTRIINTNVFDMEYRTNGGTNATATSTFTLADTNWHHYAIVRDGTILRFFVDGVARGTVSFSGITLNNASRVWHISSFSDGSQAMNGHIDEVRISKGIARWTTAFTPPTVAYFEAEVEQEQIWEIDETIEINDTSDFPNVFEINETVEINDTTSFHETVFRINETLEINDAENFITVQEAHFAAKIISINPLIFVTNANPAEIVKVDITDPENPTHEVVTLLGATFAVDVVYNSNTGFLYVACQNGIVVKVELDDLNNQELIDTGDSDAIETVGVFSDFGITYAGTENNTGEIYLIDERENIILDTDLHLLQQATTVLNTELNLILAEVMDTDLHLLQEQTVIFGTELHLLDGAVDAEVPIERLDIHVFLDNVEVSEHDVDLRNIRIDHNIDDDQMVAGLRFTRQHDNPDIDLDGNARPITNQNALRIEIKGHVEFNGKIDDLNCLYDRGTDWIEVTARGNRKDTDYRLIDLSLAGVDEDTTLYQVYVQNPQISNPFIDPKSKNPKKFKGIRVNLGDIVRQQVSRNSSFQEGKALAAQLVNNALEDGHPKQNWTYFWFVRAGLVRPEITEIQETPVNNGGNGLQNGFTKQSDFPTNQFPTFNFANFLPQYTDFLTLLSIQRYVGTSLSGLGSDLWNLLSASYKYQRIFPDDVDPGIILDEFKSNGASSFALTETPTGGWHSIEQVAINGLALEKDEYDFSGNSVIILAGTNPGDRVTVQYGVRDYFLGEAPFLTITPRNGKLITAERWEDREDGFYRVKDDANDYMEFCKQVAELEFQKLKNNNGQVLPTTTCAITLSLDAYYHYGISLLTRINVDNTIEPGVFKNNKGFPVSVKGITITSADGQLNVQLACDNQKSNKEFKDIDGRVPDENGSDYVFEGYEKKVHSKFDMAKKVETE